jgi:hypothetical protein
MARTTETLGDDRIDGVRQTRRQVMFDLMVQPADQPTEHVTEHRHP